MDFQVAYWFQTPPVFFVSTNHGSFRPLESLWIFPVVCLASAYCDPFVILGELIGWWTDRHDPFFPSLGCPPLPVQGILCSKTAQTKWCSWGITIQQQVEHMEQIFLLPVICMPLFLMIRIVDYEKWVLCVNLRNSMKPNFCCDCWEHSWIHLEKHHEGNSFCLRQTIRMSGWSANSSQCQKHLKT